MTIAADIHTISDSFPREPNMDNEHKLETLIRVADEVKSSVIVNMLADNGIKATSTGGFTAGFRAEAPGDISVVVSEKDLPIAKKLLEEMKLDESVDWSKVDIGEPEE